MLRARFPTMVPRALGGRVRGFGPLPWQWYNYRRPLLPIPGRLPYWRLWGPAIVRRYR